MTRFSLILCAQFCLLFVITSAEGKQPNGSKEGASVDQGKFRDSATIVLQKGCGSGLNEHSAIGACGRVNGVAITKYATGGHVCIKLPDRLSDKDVTMIPTAGVGTGAGVQFSSCGNGGASPCAIGWSRFEQREFFTQNNNICGRFKNWSADRDITVRIEVSEK